MGHTGFSSLVYRASGFTAAVGFQPMAVETPTSNQDSNRMSSTALAILYHDPDGKLEPQVRQTLPLLTDIFSGIACNSRT
jgi:hypothetical protein